jgi:hypothetical protein
MKIASNQKSQKYCFYNFYIEILPNFECSFIAIFWGPFKFLVFLFLANNLKEPSCLLKITQRSWLSKDTHARELVFPVAESHVCADWISALQPKQTHKATLALIIEGMQCTRWNKTVSCASLVNRELVAAAAEGFSRLMGIQQAPRAWYPIKRQLFYNYKCDATQKIVRRLFCKLYDLEKISQSNKIDVLLYSIVLFEQHSSRFDHLWV